MFRWCNGFLEKGAKVNPSVTQTSTLSDPFLRRRTPLQVAIDSGHIIAAHMLLEAGAQVKGVREPDYSGDTPLHTVVRAMLGEIESSTTDYAMKSRVAACVDFIGILRWHGADFDEKNNRGQTVKDVYENWKLRTLFREHICDTVFKSIFSSQTVLPLEDVAIERPESKELQSTEMALKLFTTISQGDICLLKSLEECPGIDVAMIFPQTGRLFDDFNFRGKMPLQVALEAHHFAIAGLLVRMGAPLNMTLIDKWRDDSVGEPLIHELIKIMLAAYDSSEYTNTFRFFDVFDLSLLNGAIFDMQNEGGNTHFGGAITGGCTIFHKICELWNQPKKYRGSFYRKVLSSIIFSQTELHTYILNGEKKKHILKKSDIQHTLQKLRRVLALENKKGQTVLNMICTTKDCDHSTWSCSARAQLLLEEEGLERFVLELINRRRDDVF